MVFLKNISSLAAELIPIALLVDTPDRGLRRWDEGGTSILGEAMANDTKSRGGRFRKVLHETSLHFNGVFVAGPGQLTSAHLLLVRLTEIVPLPADYSALVDTIAVDSTEELAQLRHAHGWIQLYLGGHTSAARQLIRDVP
jgi:hypothetical protein